MPIIAQREIHTEKTEKTEDTTQIAVIEGEPRGEPKVQVTRIEEHPESELLLRVPMLLRAGVSLPKFRVRDLLALKAGQTVESASSVADDIPVKIGTVQLGWIEFEVVERRMAVRLTRLA